MGVYLVKGKGWRYDFMIEGKRYSGTWYQTKQKAKSAESERRKEGLQPEKTQIPTDMGFLELVNRRLDYVGAYHSKRHYDDCRYLARRWVRRWKNLRCEEITRDMVQAFVLKRASVSPDTANKEIRYLRATFSFGKKRGWITANPVDGISFLPVEKRLKYVPTPEQVDRVIAFAEPDTQQYLWTIRETMGRVSEINRQLWEDVDLEHRYVVLYTRKKKGGHLTPRKVPMTQKLFAILSRRYAERDTSKPWVFWHTYWSSKTGEKCTGPYQDRKKIMATLCRKAGVPYFRFHALRHAGASLMEGANVPIGSIQRILGHEQRKTTETYLHSLGESERQALELYEQARGISHTDSHTVVRFPKSR